MADDFSELLELAADLDAVGEDTLTNVGKAFGVTSLKIKKAAAAKVSRRRHFKQAAAGITYTVTVKKSGVESEIGYDKDHHDGAKLGNIVEFGAPGSPNAITPGNELQRSLAENEADFIRGLEIAAGDAFRKRGL